MSQHSKQSTIRWYDENAESFCEDTLRLESAMERLYKPFLDLLKSGSRILDLGCGSGRDAKVFLERGFEVTAVDASQEMVAATTKLTGRPAVQCSFEELPFKDTFDAIWACASLLHVPRADLDRILDKVILACREQAIIYLSFKEGETEREKDGRHFTDFTLDGLKAFLEEQQELEIVGVWRGKDRRPESKQGWVNALVSKIS